MEQSFELESQISGKSLRISKHAVKEMAVGAGRHVADKMGGPLASHPSCSTDRSQCHAPGTIFF